VNPLHTYIHPNLTIHTNKQTHRNHAATHTREEQRGVLKTTCDRIVQEKVEAGLLKEEELDEQARGLLTRCVALAR
jgi:hypothetical protein